MQPLTIKGKSGLSLHGYYNPPGPHHLCWVKEAAACFGQAELEMFQKSRDGKSTQYLGKQVWKPFTQRMLNKDSHACVHQSLGKLVNTELVHMCSLGFSPRASRSVDLGRAQKLTFSQASQNASDESVRASKAREQRTHLAAAFLNLDSGPDPLRCFSK